MFEQVAAAPPDPILGLTEAFNAETNPNKINLSVGVYKDAAGRTPILDSVKQAERKRLETESTKSYKPMSGDPAYGRHVRQLIFGAAHELIDGGRAVTAHTPGGTGALRVAGDYLKRQHASATLHLSEPTWPNHPKVFAAAGVNCDTYDYFDMARNAIDFNRMADALKQRPAGDVVVVHGCCHNPTGADPTPQQWAALGDLLAEQKLVPLVDFAYQGFAEGLEADAAGVRLFAERCPEMIVCSSFSKNFGLYCERVGAVTFVAETPAQAQAVFSHLKLAIRTNYSNPPAHGAAIVTAILDDPALREQWETELATMRDRINTMRRMFVEAMKRRAPGHDFGFIVDQRGMFSFSGLNQQQVQRLRDEYAIYIVGSGRINVAGMTETNMAPLCDAIAAVL